MVLSLIDHTRKGCRRQNVVIENPTRMVIERNRYAILGSLIQFCWSDRFPHSMTKFWPSISDTESQQNPPSPA